MTEITPQATTKPRTLVDRWSLLGAALTDRRLGRGGYAAAVLWVVADRMGAAGEAWPGFGTIAKDAGIHRTSAIRAIELLVEYGYLQRDSGRPGRSNRYRLGGCVDAPSSVDATSRTDATSSVDATQVVAQTLLAVVAQTLPESVTLNQIQEPEKIADAGATASSVEDEGPAAGQDPKPKRRRGRAGLTFAEWAASLPEGQSPLPDDDAVFEYARSIGLPAEFIVLGWHEFARSHLSNAEKRQLDWRATFRMYVRKDWLRLWRRGRDGWELTTAGEQLYRELAAERGVTVPLSNERSESAAGRAERLGNEALQRLGGDPDACFADPAPPAVERTQQMLDQLQARRPSPRHESVAERVERRGRESERWLELNGQFAPADSTLRNYRSRARPNSVTQDFSDVDYSLDGDGDDR